MSKSLTNAWTYVVLVFIFGIGIASILGFTIYLQDQDNAGNIDLDVTQKAYILELQGVDIANATVSGEDVENPVAYDFNSSAGTPKDFAIEFLFAQSRSTTVREKIQRVYNVPKTTLQLLGIPQVGMLRYINELFVLLFVAIFIAIVYFVRGIVT